MELPQRGNALFLILIAVALFAALSYAVTTSGRGGGDIKKERNILLAAQVTEYAATVRMAATRLILTGTSVEDLQLCDITDDGICSFPSGFALVCGDSSANPENCVFATAGGGVLLQDVPDEAKTSSGAIGWFVMHEDGPVPVAVQGVGTAAAEIILWVELIQSVCEQINKGLGLSVPIAVDADGGSDGLFDAYDGEPFFCTSNGSGSYLYVHTIVER